MTMQFDEATLKKLLLSGNYVSEEDIKRGETISVERRVSLTEYLLAEGIVTKDLLGQAIAESYHVPYSDLNSNEPSREQVLKIPEDAARRLRIVLFSQKENSVIITTDMPAQDTLAAELQAIFPGTTPLITYSLTEDINANFIHYQKSLETRFSKIIAGARRIAPEILDEIFADALVFNASDIHFEPQPKEVVVRFRVDGVLQEAGRIPREHYENILNRVKVQSSLRIDEHLAAQDGTIRCEVGDSVVDLRTSIVPTVEGEKIVLRVLAAYIQGFTLADLGLSPVHQKMLEDASNKPFGMILVTGPTGSGKTTTLYGLLKILNKPDVNITTIEDPVEYKVVGINQIQVNAQTNLTFAKGLRSIVRQDPDTILVGEIRDTETAEIAVNAALTGHLLLSTFHANDAATAIPRLLDMGVEPFLLASTLEVVIAQRLLRKICLSCRYSDTVSAKDMPFKEATRFFGEGTITVYKGKGCDACHGTGYKGRSAIFEFITITPELEELILKNPSTQQIWQVACAQGSRMLFEDGVDKVKNGVTTIDELLRVAEPPAQNHAN